MKTLLPLLAALGTAGCGGNPSEAGVSVFASERNPSNSTGVSNGTFAPAGADTTTRAAFQFQEEAQGYFLSRGATQLDGDNDPGRRRVDER